VRSDLETAMGVVLTSRSARNMIKQAPGEYATYFDLTATEAEALAGMADDLAEITPGFITKRERALRRQLHVTIALLGNWGGDLVGDYIEAFQPVDSIGADCLRFADYMVDQIPELADEVPYTPIITDVARLERMRARAFNTQWPLWPEPEHPLNPRQIDPARTLWLLRSAAVEEFGCDVRAVRSAQMLPRLRPDPAHILCYQRMDDGEVTVLRVDDDTARAVEHIALRPGEFTAPQIGPLVGTTRTPEALLGKLITHGVIRGARS
jgi:hypothetical protein